MISLSLFGFVLSIFSTVALVLLDKINTNGIEVFGKIVSYKSDEHGHKTPVIEFTTSEGKNFIGQPFIHASSDLDKFRSYNNKINTKIKILYNAESPEIFIIKGKSYYFLFIILFLVGIAFTTYSIITLLGYSIVF
ncbi:DUF3592 domain-containing protein [Flavobacterium potami]